MTEAYMCYVEGSKGARRVHPSLDIAKVEAERLSKKHRNIAKRVFVLQTVACFSSQIKSTEYVGG